MARWFKAAGSGCNPDWRHRSGDGARRRAQRAWPRHVGDGPDWGMGAGWHMGMGMWGHWRGGRGSEWMLDRTEGRLAFTKTELKITDAQSAAWNELADAVRTAAKHHNERMKSIFAGNERSKTLPERVEAQEQLMTVRVEEIKLIKAALNSLYAVLSDEQRGRPGKSARLRQDRGPNVSHPGPWPIANSATTGACAEPDALMCLA